MSYRCKIGLILRTTFFKCVNIIKAKTDRERKRELSEPRTIVNIFFIIVIITVHQEE